jgi:hypothetical protein
MTTWQQGAPRKKKKRVTGNDFCKPEAAMLTERQESSSKLA